MAPGENIAQSRLESRAARCRPQGFAWVQEAGLSNGVVLGVELEGDSVADGCRDVGWAVSQSTIGTNNDLMVSGNSSGSGGYNLCGVKV
jgi:hypothetical protein